MHSAGFEPATRTFQQPQTDALDRTATGMLLNRIFGHELHRNFFVGGGGCYLEMLFQCTLSVMSIVAG